MRTTTLDLPTRRSSLAVAAVGLVATLVLAGCAGPGSSGSGAQDISHPSGPHDLILRVETSGGLIAPDARLGIIPEFSLFGDGTVVAPGATPMIFPGPALPGAVTFRIDEAGIQAILRAARAAGLMGPSRHVGGPGIPDVGMTTITVVANGARHVTTYNAAGMQGEPPVAKPGAVPGSPSQTGSAQPGSAQAAEPDTAQAKAALTPIVAFRNKLSDLSWLPKGSVTSDSAYRPGALAVFVRPGAPRGGAGLSEPTMEWPLAGGPLAAFGRPWIAGLGAIAISPDTLRCGVVSGADFDQVWTAASGANQLTPWRSEGRIYGLTFGLVLPDGWGACAAPAPMHT